MTTKPQDEQCQFCMHVAHGLTKCGQPTDSGKPCKCKGKQGFWNKLGSGLGNAIGESMFGGDR